MSGATAASSAENRLGGVAASIGEPVDSAANLPIDLADPSTAYLVEDGALDVFVTELSDDVSASSLKHFLRAGPGRLVLGAHATGVPLGLVAKGLAGTRLRRLDLAELAAARIDDELADQVDAWLSDFAAAVSRQIEPRPVPDVFVAAGSETPVGSGSVVSVRGGNVAWIEADEHSALAYLSTEAPPAGGTGLVPLTPRTWLMLRHDAVLRAVSSRELSRQGRLLDALRDFHHEALAAEHLNAVLLAADEVNIRTARALHRQQAAQQARRRLHGVLAPSRTGADAQGSAVLAALERIGRHERIDFRTPPPAVGVDATEEPALRDVLDSSSVRARRVLLSDEDRWWLGDSGAMLAYRHDNGSPVALLPGRWGRYRAIEPASGRSWRVGPASAHLLEADAWSFYRSFPADRPLRGRSLLSFIGPEAASAGARFAAAGIAASALMLVPAVLIGALVDWSLPAADGGSIARAAALLVALGLIAALLRVLQGNVMMRIEGRAASRLSAALWDRLLELGPGFYRSHTAGDLGVRMAVFQQLRDQVSGVVAGSALAVLMLLPALIVLFAYNAALAWAAIGFGLVSVLVIGMVAWRQVGPQRRRHAALRRLSGDIFQYVNGIGKLRSAGAEPSAFAAWATNYRKLHDASLQIHRMDQHVVAFSLAVPALSATVLFGAAVGLGLEDVGLSDFLVVYTAAGVLNGAVVMLGRSAKVVAAAMPALEEVQPVLTAVPDAPPAGTTMPELGGEVRFDRVSFRYGSDGSLVLDDVSMVAHPGEFIAVVGESGAGKSTLLRLALGLERPTAGAVFYDGIDAANLDRRLLRRQIGVVVQDGALLPGNILDNIIGFDDGRTIDDAWEAARRACVDSDIAAMPMQMHTVVGDDASIFSGGQAQRIRIAAALARDPRIIFLDEATSWLDAESQAAVMESIENLATTRIVIAHRLSTVRGADRIYVLAHGRVVQVGDYEELMAAGGPFADLVHRQIA